MGFLSTLELPLWENEAKFPREPKKTALYVWGYNSNGQTGHVKSNIQLYRGRSDCGLEDAKRCQRIPQRVDPDVFRDRKGVRLLSSVSCGLLHSAAVSSDGSLFTWGSNEYGQLGDGSEQDCREPKKVQKLRKEFVTAVSCGAQCTAAITNLRKKYFSDEEDETWSREGRLWIWGQNQNSNLPRLFRGAFPPKTVVKLVSCGATHAAAISEDGLLQTWGYNEFGQLGRGRCCEGLQKAELVMSFVCHLDEPPSAARVSLVACGDFHTAAIDENGDLYTWGWGSMGQLGHRSLQSRGRSVEVLPRRVVSLEGVCVAKIACGRVHTCAVSNQGALYVWGGGEEGQLGIGNRHLSAPLLSRCHVLGALQRLPNLVMPFGVKEVVCGQDHVLAATSDNRLLGWGYNSCGQAASGKDYYAWLPTEVDWCVGEVRCLAAGGGHSAVLTHACTLKELCEFQLAEMVENVDMKSIARVIDHANCLGADSLVRYCKRYREAVVDEADFKKEINRKGSDGSPSCTQLF